MAKSLEDMLAPMEDFKEIKIDHLNQQTTQIETSLTEEEEIDITQLL